MVYKPYGQSRVLLGHNPKLDNVAHDYLRGYGCGLSTLLLRAKKKLSVAKIFLRCASHYK